MKLAAPEGAKLIISRLRGAGFEAYAVGGCVRDALLGKAPEDWDITTSALPGKVEALFSDLSTVPTGIKHGTVTVIAGDGSYEVTTYRVDGEYSDHRRPESVSFTANLEEDLARRDFTVNAMAWDPFSGEIIDPFGGGNDLAAGIIRCVGEPEKRFSEDALRILRALRFASVLDFKIDGATASAVHKMAGDLDKIAGERIRVELLKLVTGAGAERVLLEYPDVISVIIPELKPAIGFEQRSKFHKYDVYGHSVRALGSYKGGDGVTAMAILLHDVGKPSTFFADEYGTGHFYGHAAAGEELARAALARLRFTSAEIKDIAELVKRHDLYILHTKKNVRRWLSRLGSRQLERLLDVKRADASALSELSLERPWSDADGIEAILREVQSEGECPSLRSLAVSGDDIIALGVPRGKKVGEILSALLDAVLDEECENEKAALIEKAKEMI